MTGLRYGSAAKGRELLVRPGLLVWVGAGVPLDDVWADEPGPSSVLGVLERLAPGGFAALPDFAIVLWSGTSATVVLRGIAATVETAAGREVFDAAGLSTWLEREVTDVVTIELGDGAVERPLECGIVVAAAVRLELSDVLSDAAPAVAPVAVPGPTSHPTSDEDATIAAYSPVEPEVSERPRRETPAQTAAHDDTEDEFGELFGETIVRDIESAALRVPSATAATVEVDPPAADTRKADTAETDTDHDGATITLEEAAALRVGAVPSPVRAEPPPPVLRSATGETIPIDRPVIVGRSPRVTDPVGSESVPRLVSVGSNPDLSRNHARFDADGGTVVVTDLDSRNGTQYTLPGRSPTRLRPGEQATLIVGAVVDLGGGATFTVEAGA